MSDLIDRQAAIDAFMTATSDGDKAEWCKWVLTQVPSAQPEITEQQVKKYCEKRCLVVLDSILFQRLKSAQPDRRYDEWCTDCKEYDKEKHCCPRWNRVIRTSLQDAQRTGRWIVVDEQEPRRYGCSECKRLVWHIENYCPNCGCAMKGEEE